MRACIHVKQHLWLYSMKVNKSIGKKLDKVLREFTFQPFPWKSIYYLEGEPGMTFLEFCVCKCRGENIHHLLNQCKVVCEWWRFVFSICGVPWVMPRGAYYLSEGIRFPKH